MREPDSFRGIGELRPLTPGEFERIRRLVYDKAGIDLRGGKEALVSARLSKRIRQSGFRSYREYYEYVVADRSGEALAGMIDALTTNFTSFLREPAHFDLLRNLSRDWKSGDVRIWSAAAATGEEPYSIAMTLLGESDVPASINLRVLATDISTRALETARVGTYPADRFCGTTAAFLHRYFLKGHGAWEGWYRVKPEVRSLVEFRRLNLLEPFTALPRFQVIFCRNVMIYFDKRTQEDVVDRLAERLEPGGYLFTGHSESLLGGRPRLEYVRPAVYRRRADKA